LTSVCRRVFPPRAVLAWKARFYLCGWGLDAVAGSFPGENRETGFPRLRFADLNLPGRVGLDGEFCLPRFCFPLSRCARP
jgi:hypothetical protein